jgi:hypothetical protein
VAEMVVKAGAMAATVAAVAEAKIAAERRQQRWCLQFWQQWGQAAVGANNNQPKSGRMAVMVAVTVAAMTAVTAAAVTVATAAAETKEAVAAATAAQTLAEAAADVAVMVAETAVVAAAATAAAAAAVVTWLIIFVQCQVTAITAGRNNTSNSISK